MSEPSLSNNLWPDSLNGLNLTLPTTAENLALDEALLESVQADPAQACLRFWISPSYSVVLGRSNRIETEVNLDVCRKLKIPVYRRMSGGGTVLIGPGCLCYSLALPISDLHGTLGISGVTAALMTRTAAGLKSLLPDIEVCGTSDLAQNGHKISGNAQRWLKHALIHHGTLLFDFDLGLMQRCLNHPSREPAYRSSRRHDDFVRNLDASPHDLQNCLSTVWRARPAQCAAAILNEAIRIAASRYTSAEWLLIP